MREKATPFIVLIVALLILSHLSLEQLEALSTKQPQHRKIGNGKEDRRNEIVIQIKVRVKGSRSRRGPQKKEPHKRVPHKKPPCKPPIYPP
ncbi:unnamed protein product [Cochlearia groenlandica]